MRQEASQDGQTHRAPDGNGKVTRQADGHGQVHPGADGEAAEDEDAHV